MAIDESGRDPSAFAVDHARTVAPRGWKLGLRTGESNSPLARRDRAGFDDANARPPFDERRKPRVEPDRLGSVRVAWVKHGAQAASRLLRGRPLYHLDQGLAVLRRISGRPAKSHRTTPATRACSARARRPQSKGVRLTFGSHAEGPDSTYCDVAGRARTQTSSHEPETPPNGIADDFRRQSMAVIERVAGRRHGRRLAIRPLLNR